MSDDQGITTSYIIFGTEMLPYSKHFITFATAIGKQGTLTEWLGSGLQNRARQFDSARYLKPIRCKTLESSTLQRMFFLCVLHLNGSPMSNRQSRSQNITKGLFPCWIGNKNGQNRPILCESRRKKSVTCIPGCWIVQTSGWHPTTERTTSTIKRRTAPSFRSSPR